MFCSTGEGDAEVSKTASATAEDTETVTKSLGFVGSMGWVTMDK